MQNKILYIRKSCITGKVVFLYYGASLNACRVAYFHAKQKAKSDKMKRKTLMAELKRNILHVRDECIADLDPMTPLTPEQRKAIKIIEQLASEPYPACKDFLEHVEEEERRRVEDAEIRQQMRKRRQTASK